MQNIKRFQFCYPVTVMTGECPVCVDTLLVEAIGTLYPDGTVRTVDIDKVTDSEGVDISRWYPFIECLDGDLNKALEAAALDHITGMLELQHKKPDLFTDISRILYPGYLAET